MANIRYSIPARAQYQTKRYDSFRGADFSTDPSQVSDSRSPWPLNLIADSGGFPEKRPGWRVLCSLTGRINGIYRLEADGGSDLIAHVGTTIVRWYADGVTAAETLRTGVTDQRSMGIVFRSKLWLLTGGEYLVIGRYDVAGVKTLQCKTVREEATVPETSIARTPSGAGTLFEPVNLTTPWRKNSFLADGSSTVYQLDGAPIDSDGLTVLIGEAKKTEGTDYTVNRTTGQVTFTAAPPKPAAGSADNVFITFSRTVAGYAEKIGACTIAAQYGVGATDRIFLSGNPAEKNLDWHTEFNDPSYIADTSYAVIGSGENAIMGYLRISDNLAIIKEDNQQDSTIFMRSCVVAADGSMTFPARQGVQSVGAISKYCFSSLRDDPLFLSASGVHAVATVTVTLERTVRRRSQFVDARLTREPGLETATACVWGDWYLLAVNHHAYVADSKQQSTQQSLSDTFGYEWYYWDNIPARVLLEQDGIMYFGTEDGRICQFNTDRERMNRYSDNGAAIVAEWQTKADDDGDFMRVKTMPRRGSGVMLKPYTSSSVKVLARTEKDFGRELRRAAMSIFDFEDLDFDNFDFNTSDAAQVIPLNKKIKKYKTLQFVVRNEAINQGFGVFGIIKRYRVGNFVK